MKNVDIMSKVVARKGEAMASPSKEAASLNLSGYLLKEIWDKCWEIKTTEQGEEYIFGKLPVILQSGLTSFADTGEVDLPSLYDGLVIDNETIIWDEVTEEVTDEEGNVTTKVVKVLKAKGSGSGEGTIKDVVVNGSGNAITDVTLSTDKTGLVFTKGLEFAEKKYVDDNFKKYLPLTGGTMSGSITLDGGSGGAHGETILNNGSLVYSPSWGQDFVIQSYGGQISFKTYGGVNVDGGQITYNASEGYFQLDGDLLVTGGITAFADRYSSTSIMDAIVTDEQTITVEDINGVKTLKVIGGADKGVKVELVTSSDQATEEDTLYVIV